MRHPHAPRVDSTAIPATPIGLPTYQRFRPLLLAILLLGVWVSPAVAEVLGTGRVIRRDTREFEGRIEEFKDYYKIDNGSGIITKLYKRDVLKVVLDSDEADDGESPTEEADAEERDASAAKPDDGLPADRMVVKALKQLMRVDDSHVIMRDHFVVIHSGDRADANRLAARLERIWEWNERLLKMLELEPRKVSHKLNIVYFGTHAEFIRMLSHGNGGLSDSAMGFYNRLGNVSMFFDMSTRPDAEKVLAETRRKSPRALNTIRSRLKHLTEFYNCSVIQHEAAHHVHFNMGPFSRSSSAPVWLAEGLAMMFETPPGRTGGSLGTINAQRLEEWHKLYGKRPISANRAQTLLFEDQRIRGGQGREYSLAWAMSYYLWSTKRERFVDYVHRVAKRKPDKEYSADDNYREFVKSFGRVDNRFIDRWHAFMHDQPRNPSTLPWNRWMNP